MLSLPECLYVLYFFEYSTFRIYFISILFVKSIYVAKYLKWYSWFLLNYKEHIQWYSNAALYCWNDFKSIETSKPNISPQIYIYLYGLCLNPAALNIKLLEPLAQGASRFEKFLAPRKIYWPPFPPDRRLYSWLITHNEDKVVRNSLRKNVSTEVKQYIHNGI